MSLTDDPSQYELESRWVTAEGVDGVKHRYSDLVRICSGEYSGKTGEVIALISIKADEPVYGVVLPPNEEFVVVSQQELEPIGSNAGRTLRLIKPI